MDLGSAGGSFCNVQTAQAVLLGNSSGTTRAQSCGMTPQQLRARTEAFASEVATFVVPLLGPLISRDQARQLLRAADGMASNYRAAGRGRSHAEFTAKIGVVLEEADEVEGCLRRLRGRGSVDEARRQRLLNEACELVLIFGASARTAKRNTDRYLRKRIGKCRSGVADDP